MASDSLIAILVACLALSISLFIWHYGSSTLVDQMVTVPAISESNSSVAAIQGIDTLNNSLDYVFGLMFLGFILLVFVTSWILAGNAVFMILFVLIWAFSVALSAVAANVWEAVTEVPKIASTLTAFPITDNIMLNLPVYLAIIGLVGFVITYGKPRVMNQ